MTSADIYEAIYLNNADTLMARAFRMAAGCPLVRRPGRVIVRSERYRDIAECFENRKRVRI